MKLSKDLLPEFKSVLLKYGFKPTILEKDLPTNTFTEWNTANTEQINELLKLEAEITNNNIVMCYDHPLEYYSDCLFYECDYSRRGQQYYIIYRIDSNKFEILATKPDGEGGSVELPDILLELIKNGIIV
jgi:hypothetical protein